MALGTAAAIIGSSVIGGASSYLGSKKQAKAADRAGATAVRGAEGANAAIGRSAELARGPQVDQFGRVETTTQPWRDVGQTGRNRMLSQNPYIAPNAMINTANPDVNPNFSRNPDINVDPRLNVERPGMLDTLQGSRDEVMNAFYASPDYDFRRSEGNRDIQSSFAAGGSGQSGNAMRALAEYNSNLASGEFGNWFGRQYGMASDDYNRNLNLAEGDFNRDYGQQADNYSRAENQFAGNYARDYGQASDNYARDYGRDADNYARDYGQQVDNYNRAYGAGVDLANIGLSADQAYLGAGADFANNMSNIYSNEGANYASNILAGAGAQGNAQLAAGDARASGIAGLNNAFQSGLGNYMYMSGNQPKKRQNVVPPKYTFNGMMLGT